MIFLVIRKSYSRKTESYIMTKSILIFKNSCNFMKKNDLRSFTFKKNAVSTFVVKPLINGHKNRNYNHNFFFIFRCVVASVGKFTMQQMNPFRPDRLGNSFYGSCRIVHGIRQRRLPRVTVRMRSRWHLRCSRSTTRYDDQKK